MIFISYRREDSAATAARLHFELSQACPNAKIFMDTESIRPGADFRSRIVTAVQSSTIVLIIIGPRWNLIDPATGAHRLLDPSDVVRLEIKEALRGYKYVFPIVLDNASMPKKDEMPPDISEVCNRNAIFLYSADIATGVSKLARQLTIEIDEVAAELYEIGNGFLTNEEPQKALAFYNQALTLNSQDARFYSSRGSANEALNDLEAAVVDYGRAIQLEPSKALNYALRSMANLSMDRPEAALEDINLGIKRNLTDHRLYSLRATIFRALGRTTDELQDLSHCASLQPNEESYKNRMTEALRSARDESQRKLASKAKPF